MKTAREFWLEYDKRCEKENKATKTSEVMEAYAQYREQVWIKAFGAFCETVKDSIEAQNHK